MAQDLRQREGRQKGREILDQLKGLNLAWRRSTGDCSGNVAEFINAGSRAAMEITRPLTTRPMPGLNRMGPGQTDGVSQKKTLKVMYLFAGTRRQSDVGLILRPVEQTCRAVQSDS